MRCDKEKRFVADDKDLGPGFTAFMPRLEVHPAGMTKLDCFPLSYRYGNRFCKTSVNTRGAALARAAPRVFPLSLSGRGRRFHCPVRVNRATRTLLRGSPGRKAAARTSTSPGGRSKDARFESHLIPRFHSGLVSSRV